MTAGSSKVSRAQRSQKASRHITINDIAKRAGVSKTAVSFAFNVPGRLSEKTTQHILQVAREMGYTPNPIARSLNTRRTNTLGVLLPQDISIAMRNPFFAELLSGIGEVCSAHGLSLLLVPPLRGSLVEATYAALIDGCIVTGLEADDPATRALRQRRIPFVMVDVEPEEDIPAVSVDDAAGAYFAMKHVLELGHHRIGIASFVSFTGRLEEYTGTLGRRFNGYLRALHEHGLTLDNEHVRLVECSCDVEGGKLAFHQFWSSRQGITAIVALSDVIAYGVVQAASEQGVRIPQQLSVVGFDDLEFSRLLRPPLTTVRQPIREKGRLAAEMFARLYHNEPLEQHTLRLPVELVVRQSCAPPQS